MKIVGNKDKPLPLCRHHYSRAAFLNRYNDSLLKGSQVRPNLTEE